jgi:hypothetical protein
MPLSTNDGETFEDVEITAESLRLYSCAASRRRKSGVAIYGLPWFAGFTFPLFNYLRFVLRRSFSGRGLRSDNGSRRG